MAGVFTRSTSKDNYGQHEFSQTAVAMESFDVMARFLGMQQQCTFTESDRQAMIRSLDRLAMVVGQMDAGQRGRGVSFDQVPHEMVRVCVGAMRMAMSGKLNAMEVDE